MKMLTVEQEAADDAKLKVEEMLSQHLHRMMMLTKKMVVMVKVVVVTEMVVSDDE